MKKKPQPIHAIYRAREDGDWEFVSAWNVEELDANSLVAPMSGADYVRDQRDGMDDTDDSSCYRIVRFDEPNMPSVLASDKMPAEYNLLSPDGIAIRNEPFYSEDEAMEYAHEWAERYIRQGYYGMATGEKVPVTAGESGTAFLLARLQMVEG